MTTREIYPLRTTETMSLITNADLALNTDFLLKTAEYLMEFDAHHTNSSYDPVPMLRKLAELLEQATDIFIKNDPDPLDDRHPHRTHPDSALGNVLKVIFKNDDFMTKLVVSYILARENLELNIQGCRILLACVPGLDSKVVFSDPDDFVPRLYTWAQDGSNETLQGYAMGLLAAALENGENASKFRAENALLVPNALNRLRELQIRNADEPKPPVDFSQITDKSTNENGSIEIATTSATINGSGQTETSQFSQPPPPKKRRTEPCLPALLRTEMAPRVPSYQNLQMLDDSNSKWDILQPFLIGTQQVYPLSLATYQRYILQYLAACGEYQDLLVQTFEGNALQLLLDYIDLDKSKDIRLTFDALKYLTSLLVHRKFALEFVERDGILALLRLPRSSLASVGVVTCLYYIAYSNDVMEILCQMSEQIVDETVQYVLWCLEHSHESGMASACMFFSQALFYRPILKRFDEFDGPRKLYNYIATLTVMQNRNENIEMTEEQVHTSTQCVRGVCATFKSYLSAHIYTKVEGFKKTFGPILPTGMRLPELMQGELPGSKSMKAYDEVGAECETILLEMMRFTGGTFKEADNMRKLGMVRMFVAVRIISRDWLTISSGLRNEMCVNALETLAMMLCLPPIQLELLVEHHYPQIKVNALSCLLDTTLGYHDEDPSLRMAALKCVQRCVHVEQECWKVLEHNVKSAAIETAGSSSASKKQQLQKTMTSSIMSHLEKMWTEVRKNDGVLILIKLINCKKPMTEADSIRRLACNTLAGLARHPEVRQILAKLPIIAQSSLQILMREPVCSDKRDIHAAFCKEAMQLLQVVTGKKMHDHQAKDLQHVKGLSEKMHRQWVIENTKVSYNETELLQLIHDHLEKKGLSSVAAMLKTEAKLPDRPASRSCVTPVRARPLPNTGNNFTKIADKCPTLAPRTLQSEIGGISGRRTSSTASMMSPMPSRSLSNEEDVFATPNLPRRYTGLFPKKLAISPARSKQRFSTAGDTAGAIRPFKDLDSIVVEYFKTQHSACKNPVTTCPPFSLYYPHTCPERTQKSSVMKNISHRIVNQELLRPHQRLVSQWTNERTIFSRFRNIKTMHDHDESYTKAAFSVDDEHLIVGMFSGELHWINVDTGADDGHTNCHNSAITHIEPSKDGSMVLTSSSYVRPLSALWRLGEAMQRMHVYKEDTCVRFANTSMSRVVGTCVRKATVYDTETNIVVDTYDDSDGRFMLYEKNFASFSPDDKLIFNDGLLWDVRNKNSFVHAFDRLNLKTQFGVFHPHGTQLIINSEVYDIRTFRVVHHVPELDHCQLTFNSTGNIMYASEMRDLHRDDVPEMIYSSFRTFDTRDYSALTTVEGRRPAIDLCASNRDQKLCVIEQLRPQMSDYVIQASTQLRLIEVGRKKDNEDENDEEEDEPREDPEEEDEESDSSEGEEDEDEDEEILAQGGHHPQHRGSVFEALGRLGDDSDNDSETALSEQYDDFENMLNQMIRQARQRRDNAGNEEETEYDDFVEGDDDEIDDDENEEENDADGEEEADPDFDVGAAIDDLVDEVDGELEEEEMGSESGSDGSWRTASRIGSDDINLDELDEEEAREAQNAAAPAEVRAQRDEVERRLRAMQQQMNRRPRAMIGEQRMQRMEEQNGRREGAHSSDDYQSEEEEEINSVSTMTLNPAMRRRNRRQHEE